jgi:hypothetical protein
MTRCMKMNEIDNRKSNLSGSYRDEKVFIIGNDPKQKSEPKLTWISEDAFKDDIEHMRSENGRYGKLVKAFEESGEKFAKINCENSRQACAVCSAFRTKIRHGMKWQARTHYRAVYIRKL